MDYHIGLKSDNNRTAEVYVHLPVPATETVAGVAMGAGVNITYRDSMAAKLVADYPDGFVSGVGDISQAELNQITAGEVTEKHIRFRFDSLGLTNAERRDQIEAGNDNMMGVAQMLADIADTSSGLYTEVLAILDWRGYSRDLP